MRGVGAGHFFFDFRLDSLHNVERFHWLVPLAPSQLRVENCLSVWVGARFDDTRSENMCRLTLSSAQVSSVVVLVFGDKDVDAIKADISIRPLPLDRLAALVLTLRKYEFFLHQRVLWR